MEQLKDYSILDIEAIDNERLESSEAGKFQETRVYLKSEADKVIAELKRQIEFLKVTTDSCKNCAQCADGMGKVFDKEFNPLKDKLRREKYKRCLAMAKMCESEEKRLEAISPIFDTDKEYWEYNSDYWGNWHDYWLALAEKFKEAK